jgi:carboxymethylenebutenolidase
MNASRRQFLAAQLAAGLAWAAPIHTDIVGLSAANVKIPAADGRLIPAYRAMPDTNGPFATILVVEEILGVNEYIRDVCRRLAKLGYFALAPELLTRQRDASKIPDSQIISDLDDATTWAQNTGQADITRLGITGFGWGGRAVWLYSAYSLKLKAGVAWYGPLVGPANPLRPKTMLELSGLVKAPVLGLYGGKDTSIPSEHVQKMQGALKELENPSQIVVYPDASNGFHADDRPSYREADAKDGWQRLRAWFAKYGVA